jgi:hypothetical protein
VTARPTEMVDAYERLRDAALRGEPLPGPDLGVVRRHGMAAWIKAWGSAPDVAQARWARAPRASPLSQPSPAASELTRLIAGIVVALVAEPAHA